MKGVSLECPVIRGACDVLDGGRAGLAHDQFQFPAQQGEHRPASSPGTEDSEMQRRTIMQVVALVERAAAAGRTSENR